MNTDLADRLVADFEAGKLSRRQLVSRLMGLGAAIAAMDRARGHEAATGDNKTSDPTFRARGLHHIALDVVDVPRAREFYTRHLGLNIVRGDDDAVFMGVDRGFFLTLFRAEKAGLNHYCYGIDDYDAASAVSKLRAVGINPRQRGGRVYFGDGDGIEVQVASART